MDDDDYSPSAIATGRVAVGLYALCIYEFLLLLEDEYRLVYKSGWNFVKFVYLICRFFPLIFWPMLIFTIVNDSVIDNCTDWIYIKSLLYLFLQISPQSLLLLRTWVFSGKKKLLAWLFSIMLFAYCIVLIWAYVHFTVIRKPQKLPEECSSGFIAGRRTFGLILYGTIGMDVVVATVVVYHYIYDQRVGGHLSKVFIYQALGYNCFMVTIDAITAYMKVFTQVRYSIIYSMTLMMPNILVCRFILELRKQTNPTESQLFEQLSVVVREGLDNAQQECAEV